MYAYTVPVTFGEMPLPVMPAEDARTLAASHMDEALAKLRSRHPGADISSELAYGDLTDVLDEAAQKAPPFLTVIGNDEERDFDGWIGSHAADMLREAGHPVLAVPHTAVFRSPGHICIAGDGRSIGAGASVDVLMRLQEACNARITVLHILAEGETPVAFADSTLGRQLAKSGAAYVELQASGAVDGTIADYAASQEVDWLAVIPHQYGFWEGLFHKSHTTHMLHLAHLPILALH
jgi:nucleotide-binding universal stress UspA family protein